MSLQPIVTQGLRPGLSYAALRAPDSGGLITQGSMLIGNSTGEDSHPINRAVWILKRLLDEGLAHCKKRYVGGRSLFQYDQVQQQAAPLHVAQEAIAQPGPLVRPLDQSRDVRDHEASVFPGVDDTELRLQRREGVVRDLRSRRRNARDP